jgi:hypothetical protein
MVFESQTKLISLIPQGQRGTSIFLTLNPGMVLLVRMGPVASTNCESTWTLLSQFRNGGSELIVDIDGDKSTPGLVYGAPSGARLGTE